MQSFFIYTSRLTKYRTYLIKVFFIIFLQKGIFDDIKYKKKKAK